MRLLPILLTATLLAAPAAAEPAGTLDKIRDAKAIVLGVRDSAPPFSYLDDRQKVVGFTIDICMAIVAGVKRELAMPDLRVETLSITSATRIPLMTNGTIDLECSATTNNADRQKQVAFTNSHFLASTRFVSKKARGIADIEALRGKTVATVAGSTNVIQLNRINTERKLGITVQTAKDVVEGFLLMETDRAAAFVTDDIQLSILVAQSPTPDAYVISRDGFSEPEPYGIMLRRNDAAFKAVVDKATADLYRSPEIVTIYDRWFQSPVPPRGLNYHVPMSPELRRTFAQPSDSPDPAHYAP